MEKFYIIASVLFKDEDAGIFLWGGLGFICSIWHMFYFANEKQFDRVALVKISRKFSDINNHLFIIFMLWILSLGLLYLALSQINEWSINTYGIQFHPMLTIYASSYGIFQAFFALSEDVYPQGKSLSFVYDDKEKIHHVAKRQISIALAADLFSILLFFLLTWLLL